VSQDESPLKNRFSSNFGKINSLPIKKVVNREKTIFINEEQINRHLQTNEGENLEYQEDDVK
jgi:hypothetical protein